VADGIQPEATEGVDRRRQNPKRKHDEQRENHKGQKGADEDKNTGLD
jgi:hypothetical protein